MHDIRWIRENPDAFDTGLKMRGDAPRSQELIALDDVRREHVARLQEIQERRNAASKEIGKAKALKDEELAMQLIDEVATLKSDLQSSEERERALNEELETVLAAIPNIPHSDVPFGADENDNVLLRVEGGLPNFDFEPREHFDLGESLGMMDFETAAKLSGSRFVILRGQMARLERALAQFMLDTHTEKHDYTEVAPPLLVRDEVMYGTGQLPKFADDQFHTDDGKWLIPTAEVPLTNLVRESILGEADLPIRVTAGTYCFRLEAGAAGRDTRGMLRQHQFYKVELVSVTHPDHSLDELERMRGCAEEILKQLGLSYRVMTLCSGDMGFGARKTYDLEVWLPGQKTYREISSCSVCGGFSGAADEYEVSADGRQGA